MRKCWLIQFRMAGCMIGAGLGMHARGKDRRTQMRLKWFMAPVQEAR